MRAAKLGRSSKHGARPTPKVCLPRGSADAKAAGKSYPLDSISKRLKTAKTPKTVEQSLGGGHHDLLHQAAHDISSYCSKLPGSEESEQCWVAHKFFTDKMNAAEQACDLEKSKGSPGQGCESVEDWESFMRQAESFSSTPETVNTLGSLARAEQRKHDEGLGKEANAHSSDVQHARDMGKHRYVDLFHTMDQNKDGFLDISEFREVMKKLGDELSGQMVSKILGALDIHYNVDLDQFLTIVEAEADRSHSPGSDFLRHVVRHDENEWYSSYA